MTDILLCDDDVMLCDLLAEYLEREGFAVRAVHDTAQLRSALAHAPPQLLVLDVMMPGQDGLSALRELRASHNLPVLMLSGRGEPVDRILGLELGADDYLAKPCLPRELLARIHALLRRSAPPAAAADVHLGTLTLKPATRVALLGDAPVTLTGAEFSVLLALARLPGQAISRAQLTEAALHRPLERFDRALDVHISRLRAKLSASELVLEAARGEGYRLLLRDATP